MHLPRLGQRAAAAETAQKGFLEQQTCTVRNIVEIYKKWAKNIVQIGSGCPPMKPFPMVVVVILRFLSNND